MNRTYATSAPTYKSGRSHPILRLPKKVLAFFLFQFFSRFKRPAVLTSQVSRLVCNCSFQNCIFSLEKSPLQALILFSNLKRTLSWLDCTRVKTKRNFGNFAQHMTTCEKSIYSSTKFSHFLAQTDQNGVRRGDTIGKTVSSLSRWNSRVLQKKNL